MTDSLSLNGNDHNDDDHLVRTYVSGVALRTKLKFRSFNPHNFRGSCYCCPHLAGKKAEAPRN
jgi:hypothetical protein